MTDLFEEKMDSPSRGQEALKRGGDGAARTSQTIAELRSSRQADDAMSVVNIDRPRRGHAV